jgi:transposase-like protein
MLVAEVFEMASKSTRYTPEFKRQMVALAHSGRTARSLSKEYGPTPWTIAQPMNLMSFIADAGEKLLNATPAATPSRSAAGGAPSVAQLNTTASAAIGKYVASQNLSAQNLNISYDGPRRR